MKYKIFKREKQLFKIVYNNGNKEAQLNKSIEYYPKRIGKIFGFKHDVGMETSDMMGDTWISQEYFNNVDDCIDFVKKFHEYHYGLKNKCEIINTIEL